ncbi:hypothetical protein M427DRAFT_132566 [Gonapodya prolifera JEL478]|uniref:Uncharacterized protein n=1 Tax=Gonapodya prolifera (strain JEL478) TaxID=1344416 RepID=A0A139APE8_GONPJ|nr:hypothetical protein M427DRAFT_132566 [Gonapodya prolifera JEL478]|eukprot:KXS18620.1 hypothetical protein M427DRAFT_132566 [Gonapodya prolifera JEL478]
MDVYSLSAPHPHSEMPHSPRAVDRLPSLPHQLPPPTQRRRTSGRVTPTPLITGHSAHFTPPFVRAERARDPSPVRPASSAATPRSMAALNTSHGHTQARAPRILVPSHSDSASMLAYAARAAEAGGAGGGGGPHQVTKSPSVASVASLPTPLTAPAVSPAGSWFTYDDAGSAQHQHQHQHYQYGSASSGGASPISFSVTSSTSTDPPLTTPVSARPGHASVLTPSTFDDISSQAMATTTSMAMAMEDTKPVHGHNIGMGMGIGMGTGTGNGTGMGMGIATNDAPRPTLPSLPSLPSIPTDFQTLKRHRSSPPYYPELPSSSSSHHNPASYRDPTSTSTSTSTSPSSTPTPSIPLTAYAGTWYLSIPLSDAVDDVLAVMGIPWMRRSLLRRVKVRVVLGDLDGTSTMLVETFIDTIPIDDTTLILDRMPRINPRHPALTYRAWIDRDTGRVVVESRHGVKGYEVRNEWDVEEPATGGAGGGGYGGKSTGSEVFVRRVVLKSHSGVRTYSVAYTRGWG